jgi:hypothetical protein
MMKNVKTALPLMILALVLPFSLSAEEGQLVHKKIIYTGTAPFHLNSDRGWTQVSPVSATLFTPVPAPHEGMVRKWRVKVTYAGENRSGQSTLQFCLVGPGQSVAVFTLPWVEGVTDQTSHYSNWFIPENTFTGALMEGDSLLSARMVAPPLSDAPARIWSVELEGWDVPAWQEGSPSQKSQSGADMAAGPYIGPIVAVTKDPVTERKLRPEEQEAVNFSLEFVRSYLKGDTLTFYKMLDNKVYSLTTGRPYSKYQIAPPAEKGSGHDLADYKLTYRYEIYNRSEYGALFPEWLDTDREFKPDDQTFLFMGSEIRPGKIGFSTDDFFVFMAKKVNGEWKVVARPE